MNYWIGILLGISSSFFIGTSFVLKKISLHRLSNRSGALRAGSGGYGYLKDWLWWLGLLTMGLGELANFAAYTFAPASLITPLGALSVLVTTLLASKFLDEKINQFGKLGCVLCILGSIIIVLHSPKSEEILSIDALWSNLFNSYFINYVLSILILSFLIIFYFGPKYGNRYVIVYLSVCSMIGSFTVTACKAFGIALKEQYTLDKHNEGTICLLLLIVIVCVIVQMNYLNKSLDLYDTGVVTTVYYVMFTMLVILASAILFNEWQNLNYNDYLGSFCGFTVIIIAIYIIQNFKDLNFDGRKSIISIE